ncbi:hypothetical protein JCM6882_001865 [Rhodosporidiobolus microsporus]
MSLKAELQTWANALVAFDKQDFDGALGLFEQIADTSRIFFNLGLIHATLGGHEQAVAFFDQAVSLDPFLAVAFFQSGVSQFLLGRFAEAKRDFDEAYLYLRGNDLIDYEQLGLKFKLFSCEILFNRGLASIYLGRIDEGMRDLFVSQREKRSPEHDVIDEACADRGEGYTVFSVPVGVLFRPAQTKLENLETKDYLGQAKVVAASDANDLFIGFSGTRKLEASAGSSRSGSSASKAAGGQNSLSRSKTSAARLEGSGDGVATPLRPRGSPANSDSGLRRAQTADAAFPSSSSTLAVPSQRMNASPARLQLPTPPPSDEQYAPAPPAKPPLPSAPLGLNRSPSTIRNTYGVASSRDIIDDYYSNPVPPLDLPLSSSPPTLLPTASSRSLPRPSGPSRFASSGLAPLAPLNPSSSVSQSAELDRVATWAQQSALPSNPNPRSGTPAGSGDSPFLSRDNSGSSRASSSRQQGGAQITFAPAPTPPPGVGTMGKQGRLAVAVANGNGYPGLMRGPSARGGGGGRGQRPPLAERDSALENVGQGMLGLSLDDDDGVEVFPAGAGGGKTAMGAMALVRSDSQVSWGGASTLRQRQEMVKVRVKLRFKGDTRGMSVPADMQLTAFVERVRAKFDSKKNLPMKYKDSEGALVSILDVDDWESAMDQAREAADGRPEGKLDILLGEG